MARISLQSSIVSLLLTWF